MYSATSSFSSRRSLLNCAMLPHHGHQVHQENSALFVQAAIFRHPLNGFIKTIDSLLLPFVGHHGVWIQIGLDECLAIEDFGSFNPVVDNGKVALGEAA